MRKGIVQLVVAGLTVMASVRVDAQGGVQGGRRAGGAPAPSARAAALQDLTGYWVSVVAEHWHLRMLVPPKGEFAMLPLNAEARRIANLWDPVKDQASGEACRSYGAAAIMRVPGRMYIHWADEKTLQIDIDSGTQTRYFRFTGAPSNNGGAPAAPAPRGANQPLQWQGSSVASWEPAGPGGRGGRVAGHLKVTTTRMRPGYLRKNGVPYGERATLVEYFDRFTEPNGDEWLVVDSFVTDPQYLTQPYVTSSAFKKIPDRVGWDPTPCRADQAR
jgi:hypothetical protein